MIPQYFHVDEKEKRPSEIEKMELYLNNLDEKLQKQPVLWNAEFRYNLLKQSGRHNSIGRNVWDRMKNPRENENVPDLFTQQYLDERKELEDTKTQVKILQSLQGSEQHITRVLPPLLPTHTSSNIQEFYFSVGRNANLTVSTMDSLWVVMIVFFASGAIGVTYRLPKDIDLRDTASRPNARAFDMNVLRRNMKIVTNVLYNIPSDAEISDQETFIRAYKKAQKKHLRDIRRGQF